MCGDLGFTYFPAFFCSIHMLHVLGSSHHTSHLLSSSHVSLFVQPTTQFMSLCLALTATMRPSLPLAHWQIQNHERHCLYVHVGLPINSCGLFCKFSLLVSACASFPWCTNLVGQCQASQSFGLLSLFSFSTSMDLTFGSACSVLA